MGDDKKKDDGSGGFPRKNELRHSNSPDKKTASKPSPRPVPQRRSPGGGNKDRG